MDQPVMLQMEEMIVLDNGLVRLGIRDDGILQELSLRGGPNLASSGYWNSNSLTENPHPEQTTVPGTFTLVANKAS